MPLCSRIEVIIGWFLPPRSQRLSSTSPCSLNLITQPVLRFGYIQASGAQRRAMRRRKPGMRSARSSAGERMPVIAVGRAIDVVGIARHVVDDDVEAAFLRSRIIVAAHPAAERLGEEK